jgi:HEAT repeat protein
MLAAGNVAHPQVIDGLSGLAADSSEWVRAEASQALATLTARR